MEVDEKREKRNMRLSLGLKLILSVLSHFGVPLECLITRGVTFPNVFFV